MAGGRSCPPRIVATGGWEAVSTVEMLGRVLGSGFEDEAPINEGKDSCTLQNNRKNVAAIAEIHNISFMEELFFTAGLRRMGCWLTADRSGVSLD